MTPEGWTEAKIEDVLTRVANAVDVEPDEQYQQIGIRSHAKGLFDKPPVSGIELGNKRVFWVEPDCFVVNIVFAWEQAVGRTTTRDVGKIASHRFPMYRPKSNKADVDFFLYLFKSKYGKHLLTLASPGGAGRNKTLGQKEFNNTVVSIPPLAEQQKISEILSTWDQAIETTEKLIENAKAQKKALMQQLLTGQRRLPGFSGKWEKVKLRSIAEIVYGSSPKGIEDENGNHPIVGTGGVIGRTNSRVSDGPAIVIGRKGTIDKPQLFRGPFWAIDTTYFCTPKNSDIRWLFQALQQVRWRKYNEASGVPSLSRETIYAISILQPDLHEQHAIGEVLEAADEEVARLVELRCKLQRERSALMQQLLTGKRRVKLDGGS